MTNQPKPEIRQTATRYIVGQRIQTKLAENKTSMLWKGFAPKIKDIPFRLKTGSFSVQVYTHDFMKEPFTSTTLFEKWAGVEVSEIGQIPSDMEVLNIPAGRWAIFKYKGRAQDFQAFAIYIYGTWLPNSGEQLGERPHFENMPPEYLGSEHPEAEEYVWIPIK